MREPSVRMALHALAAGFVALVMPVLWLLTGLGAFWPAWVWFALGCALGLHVVAERTLQAQEPAERWWRLHAGLTWLTTGVLVTVWALDGFKGLWLGWPVVTLLAALALHRLITEQPPVDRAQGLVDRVDELTRSRRGAVDAQTEELRRIERDLHDGAQARLVALTMRLGRAQQRLGSDADPQLRTLLEEAQEDTRQAIAELRDLARGIAPPVLVDRGLVAAVAALADRSPLGVLTTADVDRRLPAAVETAAYFVVAEALTNAAKHAPGATVRIEMTATSSLLTLRIADDGPGGADPQGGGLSGLRQRVEALDGTLTIQSGGDGEPGTLLIAELPCGS